MTVVISLGDMVGHVKESGHNVRRKGQENGQVDMFVLFNCIGVVKVRLYDTFTT